MDNVRTGNGGGAWSNWPVWGMAMLAVAIAAGIGMWAVVLHFIVKYW